MFYSYAFTFLLFTQNHALVWNIQCYKEYKKIPAFFLED